MFDGSYSYEENYRQASKAVVDIRANKELRQEFTSYDTVSNVYSDYFETILERIISNNIEVQFLYLPMHRLSYEKMKTIKGINEQILYLETIVKKYGINTYGSFNPKNLDLGDESFYDGLHLRKDEVIKIVKDSHFLDCHQ